MTGTVVRRVYTAALSHGIVVMSGALHRGPRVREQARTDKP